MTGIPHCDKINYNLQKGALDFIMVDLEAMGFDIRSFRAGSQGTHLSSVLAIIIVDIYYIIAIRREQDGSNNQGAVSSHI